MSYEVGAVARLSGVTVRTLHHYDQIGLLRPSDRTPAGYRLYDDADLERLQRILFYRELGFDLDRIKHLMASDRTSGLSQMREQHRLLRLRIAHLERMVVAVEKAMEASTMGISLTPEERLEVFGDFDPDAYAAEVESAGATPMPTASRGAASPATPRPIGRGTLPPAGPSTTGSCGPSRPGCPPTAAEAMDAAEAHRRLISDWFYSCSAEMHIGLAEMYLADPRFTKTFEEMAPGLAQYVHDAILANAKR